MPHILVFQVFWWYCRKIAWQIVKNGLICIVWIISHKIWKMLWKLLIVVFNISSTTAGLVHPIILICWDRELWHIILLGIVLNWITSIIYQICTLAKRLQLLPAALSATNKFCNLHTYIFTWKIKNFVICGGSLWRFFIFYAFTASYFTLYETMKELSMSYYHTDTVPTWHSFIFGIIGGTVSLCPRWECCIHNHRDWLSLHWLDWTFCVTNQSANGLWYELYILYFIM